MTARSIRTDTRRIRTDTRPTAEHLLGRGAEDGLARGVIRPYCYRRDGFAWRKESHEHRRQTLEFQAEARQLLRLMVNSIYSDNDIFLRELVSNSADALDKLRLEAFANKDLQVDLDDLHISIEADKERHTLTVRDNGIGMSRDEVVRAHRNHREIRHGRTPAEAG
jgi:hypothetical protein